MGEPSKFLNIQIVCDRLKGMIKLHQLSFVESMISKFNLNNAREVNTPKITHDNKRKTYDKSDKIFDRKSIPYQQAIGNLLYLSNSTRPDITYAVNVLR